MTVLKVNVDKQHKLPQILKKKELEVRIAIADEILSPILALPDLIEWQNFRKSLKFDGSLMSRKIN